MEPWRPSRGHQTAGFLVFVVLCFAAAAVGGAITSTSVGTWYKTLAKPRWTPPDWLFGPVWTTLYFLMATSAWLVWRRGGWSSSRVPLGLFMLQLGLNVGWSSIFFGLRRPGLAFVEIVFLLLTIAATAVAFSRRSAPAALLMTPYLAWSSFASLLNLAIWSMNT